MHDYAIDIARNNKAVPTGFYQAVVNAEIAEHGDKAQANCFAALTVQTLIADVARGNSRYAADALIKYGFFNEAAALDRANVAQAVAA